MYLGGKKYLKNKAVVSSLVSLGQGSPHPVLKGHYTVLHTLEVSLQLTWFNWSALQKPDDDIDHLNRERWRRETCRIGALEDPRFWPTPAIGWLSLLDTFLSLSVTHKWAVYVKPLWAAHEDTLDPTLYQSPTRCGAQRRLFCHLTKTEVVGPCTVVVGCSPEH